MEKGFIICKYIKNFEDHLKYEEKSSNTIKKYIRDVTAFSHWSGTGVIFRNTVIEYKRYLSAAGYKVRSINSMLASLNALFSFAARDDLKVKALRFQREAYTKENRELTRDEYKRLCNAAKTRNNERLNLILQTICGTGIRVSELEFITAEAVYKGEAVVTLKSKTRTVLLVEELQNKLLRYIKKNGIKSGAVFVTGRGKPISRTNVWREMKSLCSEAKVSSAKVFPHNLRHLFARVFYSINKDIAKLADILGHSSIETTRIYIATTVQEHRRLMECMKLII